MRLVFATIVVCGIGTFGWAAEPASGTFDAKGVKIHFIEQGKGEPVVLIHGLMASAELNWKLPGIFDELTKSHRVIALDLPGHGKSDKPEKAESYGAQMAENVALLLDHLKIEKAHIVGYSLGGMVTLKFLTLHPKRAISGTLGGMGWLRDGSMLEKFSERAAARDRGGANKTLIASMGKLAVSKDELKKIDVPVKIIVGSDDPVKALFVAPLEKVRKDWPVSEIKDAGHLTCVVKKEFKEELAAWLKKNSK